jgi:pimeloyl-ACP methyl ester carboxylesterase
MLFEGAMMTSPTPVVFIHGLWLHASSWQSWIESFSEQGYVALAPGWPREPATVCRARDHADDIARQSIEDVADHYARLISGLSSKPIVIGHSVGGLVAQNLLARDLAIAAVAIDPVQVNRVLPLTIAQLVSNDPVLSNPANKNRAISLTPQQFQRGFGNAISEFESDQLYERWNVPAPGKPLFETAFANFFRSWSPRADINAPRGPLLLISGGDSCWNRATPDAIIRSSFRKYRHSLAITELLEFRHKGNTLVIDSGWSEVADSSLNWLAEHELHPLLQLAG